MFFSISTVVEKFRFSHRTQIKYLMEIMLKHFENVVITTLLLPKFNKPKRRTVISLKIFGNL